MEGCLAIFIALAILESIAIWFMADEISEKCRIISQLTEQIKAWRPGPVYTWKEDDRFTWKEYHGVDSTARSFYDYERRSKSYGS